LYERAVGFYGSLVNINAYHQPGVEAGKKAATKLLQLQTQLRAQLSQTARTAEESRKRREPTLKTCFTPCIISPVTIPASNCKPTGPDKRQVFT
jgi:hypothetical protein